MAAREAAKEDHRRGYWLPDNGLDALPDHGYKDHRAKDLGPVQHPGYFKSKKKETCPMTLDADYPPVIKRGTDKETLQRSVASLPSRQSNNRRVQESDCRGCQRLLGRSF